MSVTPQFVGQRYKDTNNGNIWKANSLTAGDWTLELMNMNVAWEPTTLKLGQITGPGDFWGLPGITKLTFLGVTAYTGWDIESTDALQEIHFPNLISTGDVLVVNTGQFIFVNNSALTLVDAPILQTTNNDVDLAGNPALTTVNLPALTVPKLLDLSSCPSLTTVNLSSFVIPAHGQASFSGDSSLVVLSLPSLVPNNTSSLNFSGCALNAASVELILRRCVLSGVTTAIINLSGGTNAGTASLNAQGQADVATLGAQVTMNP